LKRKTRLPPGRQRQSGRKTLQGARPDRVRRRAESAAAATAVDCDLLPYKPGNVHLRRPSDTAVEDGPGKASGEKKPTAMIGKVTEDTRTIFRGRRRDPPTDEFEGFEVLEAGRATERTRGAERWSVLRRLLLLADVLAGLAAGGVIALAAGIPPGGALGLAVAVTAVWLALAFASGLYTGDDLRSWVSGVPETPRLLMASIVASWPIFGVAVALGATSPATAGLLSVPAVGLFSGLGRAGARTLAHRLTALQQRTLIVGSGLVAGQVARKLTSSTHYGLIPLGLVDDEIHEPQMTELPHLARLDDLIDVLEEQSVDRVIIAFSRATHEQLLTSIRACRDRQVAVDIVPRLFEFVGGARGLDQIGGLPLLSIGAPRLTRASRVAKRVLDVAGSGVALIVLAPLFAALAVAIKAESPGPVFFRQRRSGRNRRTIEVLKFRSMYHDADQRKLEYAKDNDLDDGVMFKIKDDPRITRVGALLRTLSLDELPQLFNVLRGDMSLVGPRPLIYVETAALEHDWHERRLDLRPGMTGLWQISGRSHIPFHEMIRFDYQYVAGWSLARDLEILLATLPAVLSRRGAY
jgi:exopolysaccharide biosynthesis polyprenyl glycosylphosphotransferase